jgi:tRNA (cytidine/uridine-2'-O-)-methyltransferase
VATRGIALKVVLFQPQIPQNTGNIVRTCACTGASLLLVPPLGFSITDRWLKRAGLDYWEGVPVRQEDHFEEYLENLKTPFYFFSSKAAKCYTAIDFGPEDHLIFGSETKGLPAAFHEKWSDSFYKIPMKKGARCLNLSNSVAIVLYEAWRKQKFV